MFIFIHLFVYKYNVGSMLFRVYNSVRQWNSLLRNSCKVWFQDRLHFQCSNHNLICSLHTHVQILLKCTHFLNILHLNNNPPPLFQGLSFHLEQLQFTYFAENSYTCFFNRNNGLIFSRHIYPLLSLWHYHILCCIHTPYSIPWLRQCSWRRIGSFKNT